MGINNLRQIVEKYAKNGITEKNLSDYSGKIIVIDTSIYIYRGLYSNNGDPIEPLLKQIIKLLKNGIIPVYIFDGKPPVQKNDVLNERKQRKKELIDKRDEISELLLNENLTNDEIQNLQIEYDKINRKILIVTPEIISNCKKLFSLIGIPFIEAIGEGEILCAKLIKNNLAHGCLSEDFDLLANGGNIFIKNFNSSSNKIIEYNLTNILNEMEYSYEMFLDLCILCGCDYTKTIKNIGIERAFKFIKQFKNIETLIDYINSNKTNFIVPDDFNFIEARKLFSDLDKLDDISNINLSLKKPNIDELLLFIENKVKKKTLDDVTNYFSKSSKKKLVQSKLTKFI